MAKYITVDSGTTNTRLCLWSDGKLLEEIKVNVGAQKGIGQQNLLRKVLKEKIGELLERHSLSESQIRRILAAGMITSEFGLIDLPHNLAPAGLEKLHETMHEIVLDDISKIPFVFIRGVKTGVMQLENADMMRGEEAELMGCFEGEGTYILPGSHSKIIQVDGDGRILAFKTMLTGEMIAALSQNTILKDAVQLAEFEVDKEFLKMGYDYTCRHGINEALFKARILKNLFGKTPSEIYNFYMGSILCGEIRCVLEQDPPKIIIGGKRQIKAFMAALLGMLTNSKVVVVEDERAEYASAYGMIRIYEGA